MKYDDDELAEAALLLAHVAPDRAMPEALEAKIAAQGEAVAAEVRFSTTKAGALVQPAAAPERQRATRLGSFGFAGWLAAAACFALVVYQWRSHAIEQESRRLAAATAGPAEVGAIQIPLVDPRGVRIGEVRYQASKRGHLVVAHLAPSSASEHYRLWLSESDAAHAVAVGAFVCLEASPRGPAETALEGSVECDARTFTFESAASLGSPRRAWVTRAARSDLTVGMPGDASRVVGEGSREPL